MNCHFVGSRHPLKNKSQILTSGVAQNFTVETLVDLERVLEIKLLDLGEAKNAERTIKQYNIDILVPFNRSQQMPGCYLSEPGEAFTYYKQTIYS